MSPIKQPKIKFNNGIEAPALGLGTWQGSLDTTEQAKDAAYEAVTAALEVGFRHIDTAAKYTIEDRVGDAIRDKINDGTLTRAELFVTSKVWCNSFRPDLVEKSLLKTLQDLKLDYLDLFLIHWPMAIKEGGDWIPVDEKNLVIPSDVKFEDTWKAMEELVKKGLVRSIGISNFNSVQVERILKVATIKPVTNQVECHPYLTQEKLSKFCSDRGIVLTAYSPLGSPGAPWGDADERGFLENQRIKEIAKKYNKTPAQVILRYQVDRGHLVIPKSANKERIKENFQIYSFSLTKDEVAYITSLNKNIRLFFDFANWMHLKEYPFNIEY